MIIFASVLVSGGMTNESNYSYIADYFFRILIKYESLRLFLQFQ